MLHPGAAVDVAAVVLPHELLPAEEVRDGAPAAGSAALAVIDDVEVGVWEMTPGVAVDIEADEVFVVVAGHGRLVFVEPELPEVELRPGVIVRLTAGMRTVWTIDETLRKVYVA